MSEGIEDCCCLLERVGCGRDTRPRPDEGGRFAARYGPPRGSRLRCGALIASGIGAVIRRILPVTRRGGVAMAGKVTVHDPRGYAPKVEARRLAQSVDTLDGRSLYLVDGRFNGAGAV